MPLVKNYSNRSCSARVRKKDQRSTHSEDIRNLAINRLLLERNFRAQKELAETLNLGTLHLAESRRFRSDGPTLFPM